MKMLRIMLVLPILWLSMGCGGVKSPPPSGEIDAAVQSEIEAHDRAVDEAEGAQE